MDAVNPLEIKLCVIDMLFRLIFIQVIPTVNGFYKQFDSISLVLGKSFVPKEFKAGPVYVPNGPDEIND